MTDRRTKSFWKCRDAEWAEAGGAKNARLRENEAQAGTKSAKSIVLF